MIVELEEWQELQKVLSKVVGYGPSLQDIQAGTFWMNCGAESLRQIQWEYDNLGGAHRESEVIKLWNQKTEAEKDLCRHIGFFRLLHGKHIIALDERVIVKSGQTSRDAIPYPRSNIHFDTEQVIADIRRIVEERTLSCQIFTQE